MRYSLILGVLAASVSADKPAVDPTLLKADIARENLLAGCEKLQTFADESNDKNRQVNTPGYEGTVAWLKDSLESVDYYDVSLQTFDALVYFSGTINDLTINGTAVPESSYSLFEYSPSGKATAPLMIVEGGCNKTDYPADLAGKIAIISRGTCDFGLKSAFAGSAGAVGLILYNIDDSAPIPDGTLLAPPRPEGPYVPTLNVIRNVSTPVVAALKRGERVIASLDIDTDIRNITTSNLLATTKSGDQKNRLLIGAHTDTVATTPGINDNASGVIALLEVAKALSKYDIKNAVTFAFWSVEEYDRQGSVHFVFNLSSSEAAKIRGYLNFDMIASLNHVNGVYDGDGKAFNNKGPVGSAEFQKFFQDYFKGAGENFTAAQFDGRGDYQVFGEAGIAIGGTFTGAEKIKTAAEADMFGGQAGQPYDPCYHKECDRVSNLNMDTFELHAKGIAAAVATYATSWEGFPVRNTTWFQS